MTNKCPTCGSTATIDNGSACAQCGCDRDADERLALTPCSALEILWSCGLHPKYHPDLKTAAEGVRETIRQLRRDLSDPTHDIQCRVLEKLGVDGFAKPEDTTHRLVMFNPNSPHNA